jgi:hypothetical protein
MVKTDAVLGSRSIENTTQRDNSLELIELSSILNLVFTVYTYIDNDLNILIQVISNS